MSRPKNTKIDDIDVGRKVYVEEPIKIFTDEFDRVEYLRGQAIQRMHVLQGRMERRVPSRRFPLAEEINDLAQDVDRYTKRLREIQLMEKKKDDKIKIALVTFLFVYISYKCWAIFF